jgi:prepilin-type N-terminal cleavage/methylation domain-containing protein
MVRLIAIGHPIITIYAAVNMKHHKRFENGFTLLEMLLVLVIVSSLIVMYLNFSTNQFHQQQRDKTVIQMQQILNAALAYYNQNGRWPTLTGQSTPATYNNWVPLDNTNELIVNNYLSPGPTGGGSGSSANPWVNGYGGNISTYFDPTTGIFYVGAGVTLAATVDPTIIVNAIIGQLPSGMAVSGATLAKPPVASTCGAGALCTAITSVPPPGQNLNNARSINFASLYKSGQCVPVPACPPTMTPQIFAVPVSVSGTATPGSSSAYPINGYTAYATGPSTGSASATNPSICTTTGLPGGTASGISANCGNTTNVKGGYNNQYWRVCLLVITDKVSTANPAGSAPASTTASPPTDTQNAGTIMAVTRCAPGTTPTTNEPTGSSSFSVF